MPRFIFLLSVIFFPLFTYAQDFEWVKKTGGFEGRDIAVDGQGNVITASALRNNNNDCDPGPGSLLLSSAGENDILVSKFDTSGNLLWAKRIGGAYNDEVFALAVDPSDNILLTGNFKGTVDFDPGAGVLEFISTFDRDMFVVKLDPDGNLAWANEYDVSSSSEYMWGHSIAIDHDGNIGICGGLMGTTNFNPNGTGTAGVASSYSPNAVGFVLCLDATGGFKWQKHLAPSQSTGTSFTQSVAFDDSSHLYLTGGYSGHIIFDPPYNMPLSTLGSGFIAKIDLNGSYIWLKEIGDSGSISPSCIYIDHSGNICLTGRVGQVPTDFDPGPGYFPLSSQLYYDIFICQLNAHGEFRWAKQVGSGNYDMARKIAIDSVNNLYITGSFFDQADFDPGPQNAYYTSNGNTDIFVLKLDSLGNFIWAKQFGSSLTDEGMGIALDDEASIYLTGHFGNTVDFDPGIGAYPLTATAARNAFVHKMGQGPCAYLSFGVDSIRDWSCGYPGLISLYLESGTTPYAYSWNTVPPVLDSALTITEPGIYEITGTDSSGCTETAAFIINGPTQTAAFDLDAQLVSGNFRPGFETQIQLDAYNNGCTPVSGSLKLVLDTLVTYHGANPVPDQILGDTLLWNFNALTYDSVHITPLVFVSTDTAAVIGDTVHLQLYITPLQSDADTSNNIKAYTLPVINGYDPNDKQVYPQGLCAQGFIPKDQKLTYTVRFQNTGNADAVNIFILDSLSSALDLGTVRIISKSHPMYTEVLTGNVLKFVFNDIHLPDSNTNEPQSHGYVIFEVNPLQNLPIGTPIRNRAQIYFDYNPAVITNRVLNTLSTPEWIGSSLQAPIADSYQWVDCVTGNPLAGQTGAGLPLTSNGSYAVQLTVNGCVFTTPCYTVAALGNTETTPGNGVTLYPNPALNEVTLSFAEPAFAHIRLIDLNGRTVLEKQHSGQAVTLTITDFPAGFYMAEITQNGVTQRIKWVKQ